MHGAILEDFADLGEYSVYACGSVGMVQAARPELIAHGLGADQCFSDAFLPATTSPAPAEREQVGAEGKQG